MKILHLISDLDFESGGPAKACFEMAKAVAKKGHTVKIFTTTFSRSKDFQPGVEMREGVEIHFFPVHFPRFLKSSVKLYRAIKKECENSTPDVMHIHSLYLFHNLVGGYLGRRYQIPRLLRPHSILDPYIRNRHRWRKWLFEVLFENKNIKTAVAIHFTAEDEKKLAAPYAFGTKGMILPLGLNLSEYNKVDDEILLEQFPELKGKSLVLFLGRINFKKGFDILIPAFSKLVESHPNAHLVVAGPDSDGYKAEVEDMVRENKLEGSITFVGSLRGEEKLSAFSAARFFVLPSYAENFGIAVVEAMACYLPVLISNNVNIWQQVIDAKAGRVVNCDIDELSKVMNEMILDVGDMGQNGRMLVEKNFNWDVLATRYEKAYQELCDN